MNNIRRISHTTRADSRESRVDINALRVEYDRTHPRVQTVRPTVVVDEEEGIVTKSGGERIQYEGQVMLALQDWPIVPRVFAATDEEIVMEYIPSADLNSLSREDFKKAMIYLHSYMGYLWKQYGFVHGDLWPPNILVQDMGHEIQVDIISSDGHSRYEMGMRYIPQLIDYEFSLVNSVEVLPSRLVDSRSTPANDILTLWGASRLPYNLGIFAEIRSLIVGPIRVIPDLPASITTALTHDRVVAILEASK